MLSFACNQEYSVESPTAHNQRSISPRAIDYQISETEQLDLPLRDPAESHEVEIAASPLEPASNMTSQSNSGQAVKAPTQEVIASNKPHTRNVETATETPLKSSPTAKQKPDSVLKLELKLFKNMTIRIVPQVTPLRPMLPRDRKIDDDHLSTIANASEASSEEWSERLPPEEDTDFPSTTGQPGLREEDEAEQQPLTARDDISIAGEPTRHVDYLSHDWDERELVLSWRYVTKRRQLMATSWRLENAAWRFWAQKRDALKTVSPESLKWLKCCDITWLYGPLQTESRSAEEGSTRASPVSLGSLPSAHKNSILKWKSSSAAILEESQSQRSLVQQAALLKAKEETSVFEQRRASMSDPASSYSSHGRTPPQSFQLYTFASYYPSAPLEIKHVSFYEVVGQVQPVEVEDGEQELTRTEHRFDGDEDDEVD